MNYVGIDIHKRYSFLVAQDEEGRKLKEARIEAMRPRFGHFKRMLDSRGRGEA
jgi:hypothetical protein